MKYTPVLFVVWCILQQMVENVLGQHEVCRLYTMDSSCMYKIDGISLSSITIQINQCSNPVEVTFIIKNNIPRVYFHHTFNSADTLVSVPGFTTETKLRVRLTDKNDDVMNIEADFHVYNKAKTDFVNDDIKLWGANEHCPGLNTAAKISVGVMGTLAVIAGILVVILIYIKYKRSHKDAQDENQSSNNNLTGSRHPVRSGALTISDGVDQRTESHGFGERREERYNEARRMITNSQETFSNTELNRGVVSDRNNRSTLHTDTSQSNYSRNQPFDQNNQSENV